MNGLGPPDRRARVKGIRLEIVSVRDHIDKEAPPIRCTVTWHAIDKWRWDSPGYMRPGSYVNAPPYRVEPRSLVINGRQAWEQYGKYTTTLKEKEVEGYVENHYWLGLGELTPLAGKDFEVSPPRPTTLKDRPVDCFAVKAKSGRQMRLYFDRKTHLLAKIEYKGWNLFGAGDGKEIGGQDYRAEFDFSDYREHEGLKHWRQMHFSNNGHLYQEWEVASVRYLERVDEALFRKPEPVGEPGGTETPTRP